MAPMLPYKEGLLVLPIVHLNGTGRAPLVEQRIAVVRALKKAIEALGQMAPHGRDYYPTPGLLEQAMAQHRRRVDLLAGLFKEIEAEALAIMDRGYNAPGIVD